MLSSSQASKQSVQACRKLLAVPRKGSPKMGGFLLPSFKPCQTSPHVHVPIGPGFPLASPPKQRHTLSPNILPRAVPNPQNDPSHIRHQKTRLLSAPLLKVQLIVVVWKTRQLAKSESPNIPWQHATKKSWPCRLEKCLSQST